MSKADKSKPVAIGLSTQAVQDGLDNLMIEKHPLKPPKTLETTLFDRLETMYGDGIKRVLQVQYRWVGNSGRDSD